MTNLTDSQIDRLGALFTTITSAGYIVQIEADHFARVNGNPVTDYDCHYCGEDVGRHADRFCVHQDAMFEAIEAQDEQDHSREMADLRSVAAGR